MQSDSPRTAGRQGPGRGRRARERSTRPETRPPGSSGYRIVYRSSLSPAKEPRSRPDRSIDDAVEQVILPLAGSIHSLGRSQPGWGHRAQSGSRADAQEGHSCQAAPYRTFIRSVTSISSSERTASLICRRDCSLAWTAESLSNFASTSSHVNGRLGAPG
jgi:hypothetical protein